MSEANAPPRPDFGIGPVIADTLWISLRRFPTILAISLPAILVAGLVAWVEAEFAEEIGTRYFRDAPMLVSVVAGVFAFGLPFGIATGLAGGPIARVVTDARLGRPIDFRTAFRAVATRPLTSVTAGIVIVSATFVPVALLVWLGVLGGMLILLLALLAGCIALAHLGIAIAAMHLDGLGLAGFRRASGLGSGYRIAVGGTFFLLLVLALMVSGAAASALGFGAGLLIYEVLGADLPSDLEGILIAADVALGCFGVVAVMCVGAACIRARLVEIKEPLDIGTMVDVFE